MKLPFPGWKTYTAAAILAGCTFAQSVGWIDNDVHQKILALATALGLIGLRSAISKQGSPPVAPPAYTPPPAVSAALTEPKL